jgi:hypothetical protein
MNIRGLSVSRSVFVDGKYLNPGPSQAIRNHSPDGFNWGYSGSGPAQLALALCLYGSEKYNILQIKVLPWYQTFKSEIVAGLPKGDFEITIDFMEWLRSHSTEVI